MTASPFDRSTRIDHTTVAGLALVAASGILSLLALGSLDETVRIRWAVGTHYGPETAPAALTLAAFPVVAALTFGALRLLVGRLDKSLNGDGERLVVEACTLATVATILLAQTALVAANLFL